MIRRFFDFSYRRTWLEGVIFYVFYNLCIFVGVMAVSILIGLIYLSWNLPSITSMTTAEAHLLGLNVGYSLGHVTGQVTVLLVPTILCLLILYAKGRQHDVRSWLFLAPTILFSITVFPLGGGFALLLALLPVAVLTTMANKTRMHA